MTINQLLSLCRAVEPGAYNGALVAIRDLRAMCEYPAELDADVLAAARSGAVCLHGHDHVGSLTREQRDELVFLADADARGCGAHPRGRYFIGLSIRCGL